MPSNKTDDETEDDAGKGGKSGQVEFREFIGTERMRDDLLSPSDRNRLLGVHRTLHELKVKKQKELRDQRKNLKEGKITLEAYRQGIAEKSEFKAHPALSHQAQFSGRDRQVNDLPNDNIAETNQEKREELQYQYSLRYRQENVPKFNPKPMPR